MTKFNRIRNRTIGKTPLKAFQALVGTNFDTADDAAHDTVHDTVFQSDTCTNKTSDRATAKRK